MDLLIEALTDMLALGQQPAKARQHG
jgi:hypothetical protein